MGGEIQMHVNYISTMIDIPIDCYFTQLYC